MQLAGELHNSRVDINEPVRSFPAGKQIFFRGEQIVKKLRVIALGLILSLSGAAYMVMNAQTSQKDDARMCCTDCCCCKAQAKTGEHAKTGEMCCSKHAKK
jgi:hypothetical protein